MSQFHKSEEFWENYRINNQTVIKKIGEKSIKTSSYKDKDYYHISDILLVRCDCGHEHKVLAKSLTARSHTKCNRCVKNKNNKEYVGKIGEIINNLLCTEVYHKRNKKDESVIWVKTICQICNTPRDITAKTFRTKVCVCSRCSVKNMRDIGNSTTPKKYFARIQSSSKRRGLECTIELQDLINLIDKQNYKCNLSGEDISFDNGSVSVDRIDSAKGYTIDNIQCVHRDVNFMKQQYSQERFIDICIKIAILNKKI